MFDFTYILSVDYKEPSSGRTTFAAISGGALNPRPPGKQRGHSREILSRRFLYGSPRPCRRDRGLLIRERREHPLFEVP